MITARLRNFMHLYFCMVFYCCNGTPSMLIRKDNMQQSKQEEPSHSVKTSNLLDSDKRQSKNRTHIGSPKQQKTGSSERRSSYIAGTPLLSTSLQMCGAYAFAGLVPQKRVQSVSPKPHHLHFTKSCAAGTKNCIATLKQLRCKKVALSCRFPADFTQV